MLMLSKVREQGSSPLYEVVEYDHNAPSVFTINTMNKEEFRRTLSTPDKDYSEQNGYLISSAETVNHFTLPEGIIKIKNVNRTLFSLLIELMESGAYYIPSSLFKEGAYFKGENFSHFSNIRISNSTMFIGFSLLVEDAWKSFSIMSVDDHGYLEISPFYIAVPEGVKISFPLKQVCSSLVNNIPCTIYHYDGESLPAFPFYEPIEYIPLPVINYLFYNQNKFKNTVDFVSTFLERSKVETPPEDYRTPRATRTVSVSPSVKPTTRDRRDYLLSRFLSSNLTLDELTTSEGLNDFERYTFWLLTQLTPEQLMGEIQAVNYKLKTRRNLFALLLMEIRCKIFISDLVIPPMFERVIAQGGCSNFHTVLKRI